jgi:hypothetical protein
MARARRVFGVVAGAAIGGHDLSRTRGQRDPPGPGPVSGFSLDRSADARLTPAPERRTSGQRPIRRGAESPGASLAAVSDSSPASWIAMQDRISPSHQARRAAIPSPVSASANQRQA